MLYWEKLPNNNININGGVGDENDDDDDPLMVPPPPPPGGLGMPVGRRSSRRSSDLLDDYEETEMEARMRAVAARAVNDDEPLTI